MSLRVEKQDARGNSKKDFDENENFFKIEK